MSKKAYEFHELANIFPMMTANELEALKHDVMKNGLREPIWLFEGKIIDGRNRYIACNETGTKPKFRNYEGNKSELLNFVISLNLHRRHLNTSQRACLAVDVLPQIEAQTKENFRKKISEVRQTGKATGDTTKSAQTASLIFSVSERYIFDAKKLSIESIELFNQVKVGKLTLQAALKEIKSVQSSAILHTSKPENIDLKPSEKKHIKELIQFGMNEAKATEYILKRKTERLLRAKKRPDKNADTLKEVKFRLPETDKARLLELAKKEHISLSELIRRKLHD